MNESIRFDNYELLCAPDGSPFELGRGAMGVTYKARDTDLHCDVALKIISPGLLASPEVRDRFLREARAAAKLHHANIATVFRLGVTPDGTDYYAMEFCEGQTLQQALAGWGPLPTSTAVHLAWQVSKALRVAEQHRLIHRDLKPANLIVTQPPDEGLIIKVIDFGLAKSFAEGHQTLASSAAGFAGTAHYASPEQIDERDLDIRSDIYALGACLWFMLTGYPPFEGSIARVMSQTLSAEPPWVKLKGQPACVFALLRRMLAKNRDDRHATAAELRVELERCLESFAAEAGAEETPTVAAPAASTEAERLAARFALGERVGRDALGRVFRATDRESGGMFVTYRVIDSVLTSVPSTRREIEAQVSAAREYPHPGLVNVLATAATKQGHIVVTERIEGFTLLEILKHRGVLPPHEALLLLTPLAAVADHAAAHGLRGFSLGTGQTWVHFPNGTFASQPEILAAPVSSWSPHVVKSEVLSLDGASSGDDVSLQSMATLASNDRGLAFGPRSASNSLAWLTCKLLGGSGGAFTPLARLSEEANAILRRACSDPAAFQTAGDFLQALRFALGKTPGSAGLLAPRLSSPLPPLSPSRLLFHPGAISAGIALLLGVLGIAYYYGISAPRERARAARGTAGELRDKVERTPPEEGRPAIEESPADKSPAPVVSEQPPTAIPPAPVLPPPATPSPAGRILVNTVPPGAALLLDGRNQGRTPTRLDDVAEGIRRLSVQLEGYESAELIVEVNRGATSDPGTIHLIALKAAPLPPAPPIPTPSRFGALPPFGAEAKGGLTDAAVRALITNQLTATVHGNIASVVACYDSSVDYYDEGRMTSAALRRSLDSYRRIWPLYQIGELSEIVIASTSDPATKMASFHYVFVARNPQNGKQSRGVAHDEITVRNVGGRAVITRCRQNVTDRQKNF